MMHVPKRSLLLVFMALVVGCISTSLLQEPKPLPPGKVRGAVGVEFGTRSYNSTPMVGVRVGVAPRTEVRGKLIAGRGGEVGVNVQALDTEKVDLLLMPSFFQYDVDNIFDEHYEHTDLVGFALPLVLSVSLDPHDQFQLFAGPDLRVGKRNGRAWSGVGLHIGAAISGPRDHGTFIPECTFMQGLSGREDAMTEPEQRVLDRSGHTLSCAFGVTLGGTHQPLTN